MYHVHEPIKIIFKKIRVVIIAKFIYSTITMYSESTTENFNKIKQTIQDKEKQILDIYPYLSQDKLMS